jgi:hypothetical protein
VADVQARVAVLRRQYDDRLATPGGHSRLGTISHKFFGESGTFTEHVKVLGATGVMHDTLKPP